MARRAGGARRIARRRLAPALVAAVLALTSLGAPLAAATDPLPQEIAVSLPPSVDAGSTVTLESTATSGLPVTLTSDTPETCVVEDGVLVALAPGPCAVTATQAGDDAFAPAESIQLQTMIESALDEPLPQVITFSLPSSILVGASARPRWDRRFGARRQLHGRHAGDMFRRRQRPDRRRAGRVPGHRVTGRRRRVRAGRERAGVDDGRTAAAGSSRPDDHLRPPLLHPGWFEPRLRRHRQLRPGRGVRLDDAERLFSQPTSRSRRWQSGPAA